MAAWRIRAGHVLEVDRTAGHLGDGSDLLARGQGLRTGEEVSLACVAVVDKGGHQVRMTGSEAG